MAEDIQQQVTFDSTPEAVYRALTDSAQFGKVTASPAEIGGNEGDAFSAFGGMITGRQVELVPGKRIVQAWRVGNWPEGRYSLATFELAPEASGTQMTFHHSGFAEEDREHLAAGWHKMYWEPLKAYLRETEAAES